MAEQARLQSTRVHTFGTIHDHLKTVSKAIKDIEDDFTSKDFQIRWDGLNTYYGNIDFGADNGFTTTLRYDTQLVIKPTEDTSDDNQGK